MTKNEIISECRDGSLPLLLLSCHSEVSEEFLKSQEPFWTHCTKHQLHRAFLGGFCCFWALWPCPPCPLHTHWEQHLSPAIPQLNPGTKRSLRPESNQSCSASMEKKNKINPFFSNPATEPGLSLNPPACFSCSECLTSLFYHFQDGRWKSGRASPGIWVICSGTLACRMQLYPQCPSTPGKCRKSGASP